MFKRIRNNIEAVFRGIRSVFSPAAPALPPPSDEKRKKFKKGENPRKQRKRNDGETYVRMADRRTPQNTGKKNKKKQSSAVNSAPVPKSHAKDAPVVVRTPAPMPAELIAPPEEEGKLRFFDLELSGEILAATQTLGFSYCTEIQKKCLPFAINGSDLAAKAQTGTGKTAAFLASTMTRLLKKPLSAADRKPGTCRVLVLSPTRELAIQIHKDAEALSQYTALHNVVIFGGMDHKGQRDALQQSVDILIGTPGRILDYNRSGHLDLSQTEILVIDEADRMLDMGFIPDVRRIVSKLPPAGVRQTMLFSATLEPEVLRLADAFLKNPEFVESEPEQVITDLIDQHFYAVLSEQKLPFLLYLLRSLQPERLIIFGNMKHHNRDLVRELYSYGVDAELLSGDVPQEKRIKVLERFRTGETKVLVATDVAARGIHVDGITHVLNYDLPEQPDDYVHRVGRTGRAGVKGVAISFICEVGAFALPAIEKYAGMEIHTIQPEEDQLVLPEKVRKAPELPRVQNHNFRGGSRGNGSRSFGKGRRR
ncbi:MAG: DEAD/DEAH box helicase [Lentisphaeria bacterium]|nr:DEAD/DEAH box helicase [Lentisphaeria bacterium]